MHGILSYCSLIIFQCNLSIIKEGFFVCKLLTDNTNTIWPTQRNKSMSGSSCISLASERSGFKSWQQQKYIVKTSNDISTAKYLRNKISFFEVHWDMNCSWSRDQILYSYLFLILLGFHNFWKADLNNDVSTRNIVLKYSSHY